MMKHERGQSGRVAPANSCCPEQLLFAEMQVILESMAEVHKQSARVREESLAITTELARIRSDDDRSVASTLTEDHRQDKPAADEPVDGRGQTIMASDHHSVPRLPKSGDPAAAARAGAMEVFTTVNQNLREAGYDVVAILDAAVKFAVDRLLQTVGRAEAVRYLRYVGDQLDGQEH
jgi:hypothetical protein